MTDTSLRRLATAWVSIDEVSPGRVGGWGYDTKPTPLHPQTRLDAELISLLRQYSPFCDQRHLVLQAQMMAGLLLSQTATLDKWAHSVDRLQVSKKSLAEEDFDTSGMKMKIEGAFGVAVADHRVICRVKAA